MSLKDKQSTWQSITGFSGQPVTLLSRKWFLFVNAMDKKYLKSRFLSVCTLQIKNGKRFVERE